MTDPDDDLAPLQSAGDGSGILHEPPPMPAEEAARIVTEACDGAHVYLDPPPWEREEVFVAVGILEAHGFAGAVTKCRRQLTDAGAARKTAVPPHPGKFAWGDFRRGMAPTIKATKARLKRETEAEAIRHALAVEAAQYADPLNPPPDYDSSKQDLCTDSDAALRLVEEYKDWIRYAQGVGWLVWDGMRWALNKTEVMYLARRSARRRLLQACATGDAEKIAQAKRLEDKTHIAGAVALAETDRRIRLRADALDSRPYLLTVSNGTLNLSSGLLEPHNPAHLITKLAPVVYDPEATHPVFDDYLMSLNRETPYLSDFFARCCGMSLTGDASAEVLVLLQGKAGGGKTTLTEAVASVLGDYAVKLPIAVFLQSKHGRTAEGASPNKMRLRGARLAYAAESDESAKLDAGEVKLITGNEAVTARGLHEAPIEFPSTWKTWIVTNYDPQCSSDDSGLWRRIVKIHIPSIPAERRDPRVKEAMRGDPACRSAILAWAAKGCRQWLAGGRGREGLGVPDAVNRWTEEYRKDQDPLTTWAQASGVEFRPGAVTTVRALRDSYSQWCRDHSNYEIKGVRWSKWLVGRGAEEGRVRVDRVPCDVWKNVFMPPDPLDSLDALD